MLPLFFILNFDKIAELLFYFIRGNTHFCWSKVCTEAFNALQKLIKASVLMYLNFSKPFIVKTNALITAIGGV